MEKQHTNYEPINSSLRIKLDADPTDMLAIGIVNIGLHRVINRVAYESIISEESRAVAELYYSPEQRRRFKRNPILVRSRVTAASVGSYDQVVEFLLVTVPANPHFVSILQNLAANVIWAMVMSIVKCAHVSAHTNIPSTVNPINVGPELQQMVNQLAATGTAFKLSLSEEKPDGWNASMVLEVPASR